MVSRAARLSINCRRRSATHRAPGIAEFYREHGVGHFHAEYQGQQATFTFGGQVLAGTLRSHTALRLIKKWAVAHGADTRIGQASVAMSHRKRGPTGRQSLPVDR